MSSKRDAIGSCLLFVSDRQSSCSASALERAKDMVGWKMKVFLATHKAKTRLSDSFDSVLSPNDTVEDSVCTITMTTHDL